MRLDRASIWSWESDEGCGIGVVDVVWGCDNIEISRTGIRGEEDDEEDDASVRDANRFAGADGRVERRLPRIWVEELPGSDKDV